MIEIYTDGACLINPGGRGAWTFIVYENGQKKTTRSGIVETTTSNRMELTAIIEALKWIKINYPNKKIKILSDSVLCVNCCNRLWKRKSNIDLWDRFEEVLPHDTLFTKSSSAIDITFEWIKGHADSIGNNEADRVVNAAIGMKGVYMPQYSFIPCVRKIKSWDINRKPWLKRAKF